MKKTILIGISSGIASYKSLDLIRLLKEKGFNVKVVMTQNATKMISKDDFETASGHKVFVDIFEKGFDYKSILKSRTVDHIELADNASIMVIVPATANIMAKLAYGIADDFLTTTALAVTAPIIICPSMNVNMWHNPIVQQNVDRLQSLGYQIIPPDSGMLACGYEGEGRLPNIKVIANEILIQMNRVSSLKDKKIIVTAGGTIEKIDDVRFIANRSSGKMGIAIAEECYLRGAEVLLLRAKNSVKPRYLINEKLFSTFDDLHALIIRHVKQADVFFHVAAVSDFQTNQTKGKISSAKTHLITLKPRLKIIEQIKKMNPKIKLIAFKAEYGLSEKQLVQEASITLLRSKADAIIANDVGKCDRGFESDNNEVVIILPDKTAKKVALSSKKNIAKASIEYLNSRLHLDK